MPRVWVLGTSHGSSSTTSPTPRVRVPRHVARLIVDYFSHTAHLSASARRRLLRPRHASGCLGTLRGSSCSSSSTTSPMLCPGSLRGWSSTTSPMLCHRVPRLLARLVVDLAPSRRWTSPRSVALALAVRPVTPSRGSATCRSVALAQLPMSCIRTCCLHLSISRRSLALVLAVRPVTPSRGSATRRLVAPTLLHLCWASERSVSPLDFSSVGCTSFRHAPGHSVSRLGYSSLGCTGSTAYVVHLDAPSSPLDFSSVGRTGSRRSPGHSISRLGYSPLSCTGSTAPMSCIWMRRLRCSTTRLRSHKQSAQAARLSHLFK
jgi:hypothetical protein